MLWFKGPGGGTYMLLFARTKVEAPGSPLQEGSLTSGEAVLLCVSLSPTLSQFLLGSKIK